MSKKTVAFILPPPQRPEGEAQERPGLALDFAVDRSGDAWVFTAPQIGDEPTDTDGLRVVIDLSARRSWFELACLIWAFPYIATWMWTAQTVGSLPGMTGRR